jgi:hypothetical protein
MTALARPAAIVNDRPALSSERVLHINKPANDEDKLAWREFRAVFDPAHCDERTEGDMGRSVFRAFDSLYE